MRTCNDSRHRHEHERPSRRRRPQHLGVAGARRPPSRSLATPALHLAASPLPDGGGPEKGLAGADLLAGGPQEHPHLAARAHLAAHARLAGSPLLTAATAIAAAAIRLLVQETGEPQHTSPIHHLSRAAENTNSALYAIVNALRLISLARKTPFKVNVKKKKKKKRK